MRHVSTSAQGKEPPWSGGNRGFGWTLNLSRASAFCLGGDDQFSGNPGSINPAYSEACHPQERRIPAKLGHPRINQPVVIPGFALIQELRLVQIHSGSELSIMEVDRLLEDGRPLKRPPVNFHGLLGRRLITKHTQNSEIQFARACV